MADRAVCDVLIRRQETLEKDAEYDVLTIQAVGHSRLGTSARLAVGILNVQSTQAFWEIVALGHCGSFDEWMVGRDSGQEYWGDYNA